jgi:hypothetical protein
MLAHEFAQKHTGQCFGFALRTEQLTDLALVGVKDGDHSTGQHEGSGASRTVYRDGNRLTLALLLRHWDGLAFLCAQEKTVSVNDLEVRNGPDRADLLRALVNPHPKLRAFFETDGESVEAQIDGIEEIGQDGITFGLRGWFVSGSLQGVRFAGTYESARRKGRLILKRS